MTIQAGLEGEGEAPPPRATYLVPKASPRPPMENSDDGYDAMRDDWTGRGNDWRYSRPTPRSNHRRRR